MERDVKFDLNALNWRNYRTEIKDYPAIISANLDLLALHSSNSEPWLARASFMYIAEENGLPSVDEERSLFNEITKILVQATALDNVVYAGHVLSGAKADIYFYIADENSFIETFEPLVGKSQIEIQRDPNWEVYFDFLMPSLLEEKWSFTQEQIMTLSEIGADLSELHHIEHRLEFHDVKTMMEFIEQFNHADIDFIRIKHTDQPIKFEESDEEFYLLKLEQYLRLDNQEIYHIIEKILQFIADLSAEYIDWISLEKLETRSYLN
ncbi:MAG: TIGR01619 family protein [Lonepinella koalarum]|nr:TIGR01619 family protein [Lonepinella koalarum]